MQVQVLIPKAVLLTSKTICLSVLKTNPSSAGNYPDFNLYLHYFIHSLPVTVQFVYLSFQGRKVCFLVHRVPGTLPPPSRVPGRKRFSISNFCKTNPLFALIFSFSQVPHRKANSQVSQTLLLDCCFLKHLCSIQTFVTKLPTYLSEAVERELEEFPGDLSFQLGVLECMTQHLALGRALNFF